MLLSVIHTCFETGPNTLSNVNFLVSLSCGLSLTMMSLLVGTSTTTGDLLAFSTLFTGLNVLLFLLFL